jgi:hypothetical protein
MLRPSHLSPNKIGYSALRQGSPLGLTSVPLQALAPTGCNFPLTAPQFLRETALLHRAHAISRGFLGWITSHSPDSNHPSIFGGGLSTPTRASGPIIEAISPDLRQISPVTSIKDWAHLLLTHTHEEFATLATLQSDHACPPCRDLSGTAFILPSQIHHYVYGEWQGTMDVQDCIDGIFNILRINPSLALLR